MRTIKFATPVAVYYCDAQSTTDECDDGINADLWFTAEDFEKRKNDDWILIQGILLGTVPKETCVRGLEHRVRRIKYQEQVRAQRQIQKRRESNLIAKSIDEDDHTYDNEYDNEESLLFLAGPLITDDDGNDDCLRDAIEAVLKEQRIQKKQNIDEKNRLAEVPVYKKYSQVSVKEALERAKKDYEAIIIDINQTSKGADNFATKKANTVDDYVDYSIHSSFTSTSTSTSTSTAGITSTTTKSGVDLPNNHRSTSTVSTFVQSLLFSSSSSSNNSTMLSKAKKQSCTLTKSSKRRTLTRFFSSKKLLLWQ